MLRPDSFALFVLVLIIIDFPKHAEIKKDVNPQISKMISMIKTLATHLSVSDFALGDFFCSGTLCPQPEQMLSSEVYHALYHCAQINGFLHDVCFFIRRHLTTLSQTGM